MQIPFVDVGMGLSRKNGKLKGWIRTFYFSTEEAQIIKEKELVPLTDNPDGMYKTNIQIGELNTLNACLAVLSNCEDSIWNRWSIMIYCSIFLT